MANSETDKLGLVQISNVSRIGSLFGRTVSVADGFSIEVFRAEKHLGTILSKDVAVASDLKKSCERLKTRHDDTLLKINLGAKLLHLEGAFTTSDGYEPGYKAVLSLAVVNPKQFAIRYRSQDDPVSIAQATLVGEFRRYFSLRTYDRLRRDDLDYRARNTLGVGSNKDLGLNVIAVHDLQILMDPHRQREREIIRAEELNRTGVIEQQKTEGIKTQFSLQQRWQEDQFKRGQHASDRIEESRDKDEERRQKQNDHFAAIITEGIGNQIRNELNAGASIEEIRNKYPQLPDFYALPPAPENAGYIASYQPQGFLNTPRTPSSGEGDLLDGVAETDAAAPRGLLARNMRALTLSDLGLTVMPTTLASAQMQLAGLDEQEAFLVCEVTHYSAAARAGLRVSDMLVKVNGEQVNNADVLADRVRLKNQSGQLAFQVLRNERLMHFTLDLTT